jgi:recombination associated protein RdgC
MFRNVRFYQLAGPWPESETALHEALCEAGFTPCGPLTERTSGWEPPAADADGMLSRRVGGAELLQLRNQSRLLPPAAINEALEERVDEFRERMGQDPSGRERRRLKEQTRDNLLPKALLRSERTRGFVFLSDRILAIDAAAPVRAERFLESLRAGLGALDAAPLAFKRPVGQLLTQIFLGEVPRGITMGRECRMQDPSDKHASVRWVDMDLAEPSVRKHVRDGMKLSHLAVEVGTAMSCVIDENGVLSKVRLLGMDARDEIEDEDPLARLDAEFVLLTGTLRHFITLLAQSLGGLEERS